MAGPLSSKIPSISVGPPPLPAIPKPRPPQPEGRAIKISRKRDPEHGIHLLEWAREHGGTSDEPGWWNLDSVTGIDEDDQPAPGKITISAPSRFLQKHVYGDKADKVIATMASGPKLGDGPSAIGRGWEIENNADRTHYEIRSPGFGGGVFMTTPKIVGSTITPRLSNAMHSKGWPEFARRHEWGHALQPLDHGADITTPFNADRDSFVKSLTRALMDSGASRNTAESFGRYNGHFAALPEASAQANVFKGLHYGVTGQIPTLDSDFDDLVQQLISHDQELLSAPSSSGMIFPQDPVMQYGPAAGKQADGYNYLKFLLRSLIQPDQKPTNENLKRGATLLKVSDASSPLRSSGSA